MLTRRQLDRWLLEAVDILRGKMSPDDYWEFIIALLFLKRASDVFEEAEEKCHNTI